MECGKLTAKLRDAVPVCLIEDGKEIKRYKNIEIPDEIKQLPFMDFKFDVPMNGAITFMIIFEAGVLPTEWPQARERKTRTPKDAAQATTAAMPEETTNTLAIINPDPLAAIIEAAQQAEATGEAEPAAEQPDEEMTEAIEAAPEMPATMEIAFNVTGDRRKALAEAIGSFIGEKPVYMNAPSFAYAISNYTVDKKGTLIGPANDQLLQALAAKDFIVE